MTENINGEEIIRTLSKCEVDERVLECMARYYKVPYDSRSSKRSLMKSYSEVDLEGGSYAEFLYDVFVRKLSDKSGKYAEYRLANHLLGSKEGEQIDKLDFRTKLVGTSNDKHEFDVLGYDKRGNLLMLAESKDRKSKITKVDIFKFFEEIIDISDTKKNWLLRFIHYGSTSLFTDDAKNYIKHKLDRKGRLRVRFGEPIYCYFYEERSDGYYDLDV